MIVRTELGPMVVTPGDRRLANPPKLLPYGARAVLTKIGWRYYGVWLQWPPRIWRLWVYNVWYDGPHWTIHLGPVVLGWGADLE